MNTAERSPLYDTVPSSHLLPADLIQISALSIPVSSIELRLERGIITPIETALQQRYGKSHASPSSYNNLLQDYDNWIDYLDFIKYCSPSSAESRITHIREGLTQIILNPDRNAQFELPEVLGNIVKTHPSVPTLSHIKLFALDFATDAINNAQRNSLLAKDPTAIQSV